jgi:hypothetical protein
LPRKAARRLSQRRRRQQDDRGVYRVFGVVPGKYRVSVGEEGSNRVRPDQRLGPYSRTFHPDTTDESKATVIEVGEGTEATGVDIKLAPRIKTYVVSGQVIDAETRQPAQGVRIDYRAATVPGWSSGTGPTLSPTGEFQFEGFSNGRYSLIAGNEAEGERYSEPVTIEVNGADVSGVQLELIRGGSISGVVILQGTSDPVFWSRLSEMYLAVYVQTARTPGVARMSRFSIAPDGRFRIGALRPGKVRLNTSLSPALSSLVLTRIDRDGVIQDQGIQVDAAEQVTGVRLVFSYGSGSIQGQVVAADGAFPEGTIFLVMARHLEPAASAFSQHNATTDARGNFLIRNVVPGQYEVTAMPAFGQPPTPGVVRKPPAMARQTVTVLNEQQARITMSISPQERQQ